MKFNALRSGALVFASFVLGVIMTSGSVLTIISGVGKVVVCCSVSVAGNFSFGLVFSLSNSPLSSAVRICLLCPSSVVDELGCAIAGPNRVFRKAQFLGVYELGTSTVYIFLFIRF